MMDRRTILKENRQLKQQLSITKQEISLIKNSKGYRTIRLVGHLKNQLKSSPLKTTKKIIKSFFVSSRSGFKDIGYISSNLNSIEDLGSQYRDWILFNEPDSISLQGQRQQSDGFKRKPLISILTPVFNPPADVFKSLLESVLEQTYSNFELCLGNGSTNPEIANIIREYSAKDGRIKSWTFKNKGIAINSNVILRHVKGSYVALLDHDDTLSPDALFENVKLINQADYDFIYSDKDKIDEKGERFEPFFKPDWSPEIMLNANYLTHLNIMKTSIVRKVGGWSLDTEGAQDWDLFLKVIENSKLIGHIPKVLYHWRVIETSTAHSIETKPYALEGQRNTVDKYLKNNGIKATSYHHGAELLLKWQKDNNSTLIIVHSSSSASLLSMFGRLNIEAINTDLLHKPWIILHSYTLSHNIKTPSFVHCIPYKKGEYAITVQALVKVAKERSVILLDDRVNFSNFGDENVKNLTSWLNIEGVQAVGPRIVEHNSKVAIDCGAIITSDGIKPIFYNSPPYHQAPIGNIEWVRNLKIISHLFFAVKTTALSKAINAVVLNGCVDEYVPTAIQLCLANDGRLVFNPKINFELAQNSYIEQHEYYNNATTYLQKFLPKHDPYGNPNLSAEDPMRLVKIVQAEDTEDEINETPSAYQQEALIHALNASLTYEEVQANSRFISKVHAEKVSGIQNALFILPGFQAIYAGLNNIFSYADFLRENGIKISLALILDKKDLQKHVDILKETFPELAKSANFYPVTPDSVDKLPSSDVAICTQWATAYILAKYNKTKRKCYFIQDKEASFYPMGTISALVENTYKMNFFALANTPGLLKWYENTYSGRGIVIKSKVDLSNYLPDKNKSIHVEKPYKVFFYARPNEPRNAFELGIASLVKLKIKLKTDVEIFAAGAPWDPAEYGLEDLLVNMGKISFDKLPSFYRSMDIGLMFMFSGHPGVVASELMASGCPVVVNQYNDETWNELYEHEKNCLVAIPTASSIAESLERGLIDDKLRGILIPNALKKVEEFYSHYNESCKRSIEVLKKPLDNKYEN